VRVLVLADGGPEAGLGHVSRATGLTAALRERGVEVDAQVLEPTERVQRLDAADVVVLDSYRVQPEDLPTTAPVVAFHDAGDPPDGAVLVVDGTRFEHACLKPAFWHLPAREISDAVELVVVSTGGGAWADYPGHVRSALPHVTVVAVRGPYAKGEPPDEVEVLDAPESLAEVLLKADIAVVGAGQTMLEAAAAGTPTVSVVLVDNQRRQAERLAALEAVVLADPGSLASEVVAVSSDPEWRHRLSARAQAAIDGQGARRVAALVEELG
jgi:spore coat polysaccharide biosynthesis predicted glycosyltransferase SpsG